ncbi:hypothetical protein BDW02DRAFT_580937 [Decorospora gaudefroyi]|uniref:Uncharacterized protein n=1 Tax=Decorospora gaudefroyi TaxID=184978 RepID=A0A6A5K8Z8_9PLEO|nr:hypothetical protein BDW02DRAFT_580937 [Decorospora gaudefroyi]
MAQLLPPSVLSLRLPDSRFSVDFASYAWDTKPCATSRKYMQELFPGQNKPLPTPKSAARRLGAIRQQRKPEEDSALMGPGENFGESTQKVQSNLTPNASDGSSAPLNPPVAYFVLSSLPNNKSTITLQSLVYSGITPHIPAKPKRCLVDLPQPVLEQVLGYVFSEHNVCITPYQSHISPKQPRRRHGRTSTVDIRSIMMHPVLLVSQRMRALALDVVYRDSLFIIDLSGLDLVLTPEEKDTNMYWNCWMSNTPPSMVKTALTRASNMRLRIPCSNTGTNVMRGASKSKKDLQDNISTLHDSLRAITALITGLSITPPTGRSRSASPSRPRALRRKLSFRSLKRPESPEFVCRGETPPSAAPRQPLARLEVVLTKSSSSTDVYGPMLDMVTTCSSIPVAESLDYYLEFEGKRRLWARRSMGTWLGKEPDGGKLLHDLRALGVPKESTAATGGTIRQDRVQPIARADVVKRERDRVAWNSIAQNPRTSEKIQQWVAKEERPRQEGIVVRKVKEMENTPKTKVLKASKQPPTVEELQQIAADIRKGMY